MNIEQNVYAMNQERKKKKKQKTCFVLTTWNTSKTLISH